MKMSVIPVFLFLIQGCFFFKNYNNTLMLSLIKFYFPLTFEQTLLLHAV